MSLTEIKIRKSYPKEKIYFLADDDGLSMKIEPSGKKSWSYRYSNPETRKRHRITLGSYPAISLKEARNARDLFKANAFSQQEKVQPKIKTFKSVCEEWLDFKSKNSFNDQPRCGVVELAKKCLNNDIYPTIGDLPFEKIKLFAPSKLKFIEKLFFTGFFSFDSLILYPKSSMIFFIFVKLTSSGASFDIKFIYLFSFSF